jgi:serine/threonine-protein kinase
LDVIYKHVHEAAPSIASVNPDIDCPPAVEAIIQRCLAKSRDQRYDSMDVLLGALKDVFYEHAAEASGAREAGLEHPVIIEDPTPMGPVGGASHARAASATASAVQASRPTPRAMRGPLAASAVAFLAALLALAYVIMLLPDRPKLAPDPEPLERDGVPAIAEVANPLPKLATKSATASKVNDEIAGGDRTVEAPKTPSQPRRKRYTGAKRREASDRYRRNPY